MLLTATIRAGQDIVLAEILVRNLNLVARRILVLVPVKALTFYMRSAPSHHSPSGPIIVCGMDLSLGGII